MKAISREIREQVPILRERGITIDEISKSLNISTSSVERFIKNIEKKVPKRGYRRNTIRRVNKFNDDYFEAIDSDEKAYWLGFWFADGCVYKGKTAGDFRSRISIDSKDEDHIKKFANAINFDFNHGKLNLVPRKGFDTAMISLQLVSEKMFNDLEKLGCVQRKSKILMPPKIKEQFNKSFIRGFFDGDGGSTFWINDKGFGCGINFVSTREMVEFVHGEILKGTSVNGTFVTVTGWTSRVVYGGNPQILKIFDWLYEDFNATHLYRKMQKTMDMMKIYALKGKERIKTRPPSIISGSEILRILERFLGKEIESIFAQSLGQHYSTKAFHDLVKKKISEGFLYSKN